VEELYRVLWNENCGGCVSMEQKSFALLNVLGSIYGGQHHFGRLTCWFVSWFVNVSGRIRARTAPENQDCQDPKAIAPDFIHLEVDLRH
jgi:hypothetical protein